jgi:hypothetical protein
MLAGRDSCPKLELYSANSGAVLCKLPIAWYTNKPPQLGVYSDLAKVLLQRFSAEVYTEVNIF